MRSITNTLYSFSNLSTVKMKLFRFASALLPVFLEQAFAYKEPAPVYAIKPDPSEYLHWLPNNPQYVIIRHTFISKSNSNHTGTENSLARIPRWLHGILVRHTTTLIRLPSNAVCSTHTHRARFGFPMYLTKAQARS